jgi:hypothetical protein
MFKKVSNRRAIADLDICLDEDEDCGKRKEILNENNLF